MEEDPAVSLAAVTARAMCCLQNGKTSCPARLERGWEKGQGEEGGGVGERGVGSAGVGETITRQQFQIFQRDNSLSVSPNQQESTASISLPHPLQIASTSPTAAATGRESELLGRGFLPFHTVSLSASVFTQH